jgi:hypothetical protein
MAAQKIYEKKTIKVPIYEGTSNQDGGYVGDEEIEIQQQTGWKSDVTGQFYEYAFKPARLNDVDGMNRYATQMESNIALDETKYNNAKEIERVQAEQNTQREYWKQQEQAQRNQFAADQAAAEKALSDQTAQFEADRVAREQAKAQAEVAKAEKLAGEQKITNKTVLEDMTRMTNTRDNDLVAEDDKKVLSAGDKETLFGASQQSEDEQVKAKQTLLERILGTAPAGTPKTK